MKGSLAIPCARATRGLRRPSLDARTLGKCQTALPPSKDRASLSVIISLPDAPTPSVVLIYPPFERRKSASIHTSLTRDFLCQSSQLFALTAKQRSSSQNHLPLC